MLSRRPSRGPQRAERDYTRRELDMFFSRLPTVAEAFRLKTWRGGPEAGKPKVWPVAGSRLDRGPMRLDTSECLPRLFFTACRITLDDSGPPLRPTRNVTHVRQEFGIEPRVSDEPGPGVTRQPVETPSAERDQARDFQTVNAA
jgi:hypothetical protein